MRKASPGRIVSSSPRTPPSARSKAVPGRGLARPRPGRCPTSAPRWARLSPIALGTAVSRSSSSGSRFAGAGHARQAHTGSVRGARGGLRACAAGSGRAEASATLPRTTTTLRKSSSTSAAASGLTAASPAITPRRNQRGPSTPTKRATRVSPPRALSGGDGHLGHQLGAEDALTHGACGRPASTCSAICSRISCQSPLERGAANGCTCRVEFGVVEPDRDDPLRPLLDLEAEVQALAREDLHSAEVDVGPGGVGLALVERAVRRAVRRRRLLPSSHGIGAAGVGHARSPGFDAVFVRRLALAGTVL